MAREPRRLRDEAEFISQMNRYLDTQNEQFDPGDIRSIREYVGQRSRLQRDWSRILQSLRESQLPEALETAQLISTHTAISDERIEEIAKQSSHDPNLVFLIGAGASSPAPTSIPTTKSLLPILWDKAAEISHKSLLRMRDQCEALGVRNIEELLTAIYLAQDAVNNPRVARLLPDLIGISDQRQPREPWPTISTTAPVTLSRPPAVVVDTSTVESLRDSVTTLFSVLVGMMLGKEPNSIHSSVAAACGLTRNTTVVTTNYDVCLEAALGSHPFTYAMDILEDGRTDGKTRLLKLHGSLNWYSCLNCDQYVSPDVTTIRQALDKGLYPIVSMCSYCQAPAQQLIVPPIAQKYQIHPVLLHIRQIAEDAFRDANIIVVIGYSFSDIDQYILRMISRGVRAKPDKAVFVLDTDEAPTQTLREFLKAHAKSFDSEERVLPVYGDAADNAPRLATIFGSQWQQRGRSGAPFADGAPDAATPA